MFAELLGIVGPPALGKAINSVTGIVDRLGEAQARRDLQTHEREMAQTEEGRKYLMGIHERDEAGKESLFSATMCRLYLMFGATMCVFILFACVLQWEALKEGVWDYTTAIKDPDEKGKSITFLGISYNWGTGRIQGLSPLGVAYLGYASLTFIITLTATNQRRIR